MLQLIVYTIIANWSANILFFAHQDVMTTKENAMASLVIIVHKAHKVHMNVCALLKKWALHVTVSSFAEGEYRAACQGNAAGLRDLQACSSFGLLSKKPATELPKVIKGWRPAANCRNKHL